MVVACLALGVALGGTSYAAVRLPANSVGTKQLKRNAVTSPKVKADAITGADVLESSLAQVPSAAAAGSAAQATHAGTADAAATATTANAAFSTFHDSGITLPNTLATIGALNVGAAGSYAISAKFWAYNLFGTGNTDCGCNLTAGTDSDHVIFDLEGDQFGDQEVVSLQVVHTFAAPGQAVLTCTDNGSAEIQIWNTKITAVQVARLTNTAF